MTRSKAGKKLRWYGHLTRAHPMQSVWRPRDGEEISGCLGVPLDKLEVAWESEVLVAVLRLLPTKTWLHRSERKWILDVIQVRKSPNGCNHSFARVMKTFLPLMLHPDEQ